MIDLVSRREPEPADVRETLVASLMKILSGDPAALFLDCDTMDALGMRQMKETMPQRILSCGIQEANMIGVAAGLSALGWRPYVHSFAAFATRRCYDQLFLSVGYAGNSVKVLGTDPGVTSAYNGGTHMPFEDLALMRAIPGATVLELTDSVMAADLLPKIRDLPGVVYLRSPRKRTTAVYRPGSSFEIGQGALLRDGTDATVFASGIMVDVALSAAELAEAEGLHIRVADLFSIKPIDEALIIDSARKTGAAVTAENHSILGGLGSAVAEVLGEHCPVPLLRVGIPDHFGEVGSEAYLRDRFGLTPANLLVQLKRVVARKSS